MKKILYSIIAVLGIFGTSSCSDVLESDSSRQLFEPSLSEKTDSVFYAYGIMQAMQQLADQYYFQNELRGDLVTTTNKATTNLRNLSTFSADVTNKYDSVYLYYKVINNCNYYLAHRDTTLATGARNVVSNEYAAVASFRAWAYLQLTRQYGNVPYVTEPVTTIGQINSNTAMTSYQSILAGEAQNLEALKARYSDEQISVPTFGYSENTVFSIGTLNWARSTNKFIQPRKCFVPLNVVLGDLYLELGEYAKAAKSYYDYLRYVALNQTSFTNVSVNYVNQMSTNYSSYSPIFKNFTEWPTDYNESNNRSLFYNTNDWEKIFSSDAVPGDVITYIPMAVNYTAGQTTDIPASFGYDYYSTDSKGTVTATSFADFQCPKTENIQIVPSRSYVDSARNAVYYYNTEELKVAPFNMVIRSTRAGDARASIISSGIGADTAFVYTHKPSTAYIPLYRNTTVWLHLAEAINRMGYPDAAFAVLKNGLHYELSNYRYLEVYLKDSEGNDSIDENGNKVLDPVQSHIDDKYYLTPESYELLTTTLPFLSQENSEIFRNGTLKAFIGIHFHGAGAVESLYSPYKYSTVVGDKIKYISDKYGLGLQEGSYTKEDYINAVEDLLCDEYAMEFAFEGTRFSDLRRLALHKNMAGTYAGNFGDIWLSSKLQNNAPGITTQNCYLPYK